MHLSTHNITACLLSRPAAGPLLTALDEHAVHRAQLSPDVLDSYQQEREHHARQLITLALRIGRAMTAGGRFGSALRRLVLPNVRDRF